jgi:hypothetical protein
VLVELAEDFPLLATLVEHHAGGQARLPTGRATAPLEGLRVRAETRPDEPAAGAPEAEPATAHEPEPAPPVTSPAVSAPTPEEGPVPRGSGPRRPARYGLTIQFESRPEAPELGRLVESTVWVNEAHPAYRRAAASRSEGYHVALAVAMALAPLAVEPAQAQGFITAFLARWGAAIDRDDGRRRRGRPRRR